MNLYFTFVEAVIYIVWVFFYFLLCNVGHGRAISRMIQVQSRLQAVTLRDFEIIW